MILIIRGKQYDVHWGVTRTNLFGFRLYLHMILT